MLEDDTTVHADVNLPNDSELSLSMPLTLWHAHHSQYSNGTEGARPRHEPWQVEAGGNALCTCDKP